MKLKQLLLLAALVMPFSVGAATTALTDESSHLVGFSGVNVEGVLYEVTFSDAWSNTDFYGTDFALAASNELFSLFSGTGAFSNSAFDTGQWNGCTSVTACEYITMANESPINNFIDYASLYNRSSLLGDTDEVFSTFFNTGEGGDPSKQYLKWTASEVPAVPLPAAVWLFGPALLGFMGFRRKAVDTTSA